MYKQQRQYTFLKYLFNGIFFLWLKASITDTNHWCLYKIAPPQYLTIDIQHYRKIERYQF